MRRVRRRLVVYRLDVGSLFTFAPFLLDVGVLYSFLALYTSRPLMTVYSIASSCVFVCVCVDGIKLQRVCLRVCTCIRIVKCVHACIVKSGRVIMCMTENGRSV